MIRVGLRFQPRDAALLAHLAERVKALELGHRDVATFANAAKAASTGEPLIVYCDSPGEAAMIADGYTQFGVQRPAIDDIFARGNT